MNKLLFTQPNVMWYNCVNKRWICELMNNPVLLPPLAPLIYWQVGAVPTEEPDGARRQPGQGQAEGVVAGGGGGGRALPCDSNR